MTAERQIMGRGRFFAGADAEPAYPPDLELEPVHLDISLRLHVPERSAEAQVGMRIRSRRPDAQKLVLQAMDLEDLAVEGAEFAYDGREVELTWPEGFGRGEEREVRFTYRVARPVGGLYFAAPDEAYPERAAWVATDHETERARYWLPCVDYPAVRTTLEFHLTADSTYTILANGVLVADEDNGDGTRTAHWKLDYPCPSYLICFVAGELVRADDEEVDGRPVAYFCAEGRGTPDDLRRSFDKTPGMIRWLEARLGVPFPFPKYFQFALPQFGGAMENISLVSWDDIFVVDEVFHRDFGWWVDLVNIHEMAHSYFGDAVVIRDFAHTWLKESWATYIESCWFEDVVHPDEGRYVRFLDGRGYMKEADEEYARPIVTRVFSSSWDIYDQHTYPGGARRIHMLRRLLGEEVFWEAVTDYLETYSGKTVETEDFRRVLETHSGRSLVRFFDQWLYGRGYPKLKVTFKHDADRGEGTFTVEQTQAPKEGEEVGPEAWTRFDFPLVLAWEGPEEGFLRREVEVTRRTQSFTVAMAAAPLQVRIDPDDSLLHRLEMNPGDEMLRRALGHGPDPVGRIQAAEELAKTGKPKNLEAVSEAILAESFWGARRAMAEALVKSRTAAVAELLPVLLDAEEHPMVLSVLSAEAGSMRDDRVAAALRRVLDRDPSYRASSAALTALGKQRGAAHLDLLREAAESNGWRGIVRSGALAGLAQTRTEEAYALLSARLGYGREPDDTAGTAVACLGQIAPAMERRHLDAATELVVDALRDPRVRVNRAAAGALGFLRATSAAGELEAFIATVPEQSQPALRKTLAGLRKGPGDEKANAKLQKELERLEERQRKLEERIDSLEAR